MNSRKLIIHIGYPKTATKTLQINVFLQLFYEGKIEFLNHIGIEKPRMGNIYYKNLFKYILGFKNSIDTAECEEISKISLPITVVTNESFSHVSVNSPNASYKKASVDNIARLHEVFAPLFDDIQVIMTIRSQRTIIPSYYTQEYYNIIKNAPKLKDIGKWINANFGDSISSDELIFNYKKMYDTIVHYFGKEKANVFIYEDIKYNKNTFFNKLSSLFEIDSDVLIKLFEKNQQNVTIDAGKGEKRPDSQDLANTLSVIASSLRVSTKLKRIFRSIIPKSLLKIKTSSNKTIRGLHEYELELIERRFLNSNLELITELGLDIEQMRKYGYIS